MGKQLTTTERRFREGSGVLYLADGTVRCQAQSKGKLRAWRQTHNDTTTPNDDIWPECQCPYGAVPGMFACHLHGGETPSPTKSTSLFEAMPVDLGNKLKLLLENPDYMSSREDILVFKARQWELMEELGELAGSAATWELVKQAHKALKNGELALAESLLNDALTTHQDHQHVWDEYYRAQDAIKDMRNTEVKVVKEMRLMATVDQVAAMIQGIYAVLIMGAERYIDDTRSQSDFLRYVAGELGRLTNLSPLTIGPKSGPGSNQAD